VIPNVAVRSGLPRFAALARGGGEATIVAFGTSMTQFGHYLRYVLPALTARTGNDRIRLINRGLRGFCTVMGAYRVGTDVLPAAPDLVLLEFTHNDVSPAAIRDAADALHGIVAQVRAANPVCEFAFVYLAQPGHAANGPSAAMAVHEDVAAYFGFPSIDLATAAEALVARGEATWTGDAAALTSDGIHHTDAAAERIGRPFAQAFADLVAASQSIEPVKPALPSAYARTAWRPASELIGDGPWAIGIPHTHAERNADAYSETVAQPLEDDAWLRVRFDGTQLYAWTMGGTRLAIRFKDGRPDEHLQLESGNHWAFMPLTPALPPGIHSVEIRRGEGPAVFGDVCVLGEFLEPLDA
jgi:lysophospholipase L1-like esterase